MSYNNNFDRLRSLLQIESRLSGFESFLISRHIPLQRNPSLYAYKLSYLNVDDVKDKRSQLV